MLFPLLQPNLVLGSSVLDLTLEILERNQIKGLVLDVDDTIVPIGINVARPELIGWIEQIKKIGPLWLVTNNPGQVRIGAIAESLSVPYFHSRSQTLTSQTPSSRRIHEHRSRASGDGGRSPIYRCPGWQSVGDVYHFDRADCR